MQPVFESIVRVLTAGIAGSQVTPLRLLIVLVLLAALMWVTRRGTRCFARSRSAPSCCGAIPPRLRWCRRQGSTPG